ncbi:phage tail tape measure protein [Rouxiella chamberiensis]|uniref:Phage tail tape measure protein n=1 Tax=Rouxiella chamberiensis TaxID=1513468 RepID=A0ABY7HU41_9GAMM|nr:phage tail tape measure protein [Rouxiella chamberiensis]WAT02954.1 phage tail tape measure protein [Rouxiella chamberiensis]
MSKGYSNWMESVSNISGTVSQGIENTMSSALDNTAAMLTGSKADWKSWGLSALQMIAKVGLQMAIVGSMGGGKSSGLFGSLVNGVAGYLGGSTSTAAAAGGSTGFSTGAYSNLAFNAKGGVYDSPSLSDFSNGVYDKPQMFAFAKGAGIFGEAGPEAIMPLTRSADGSLGVRAIGGGDSGAKSAGSTTIHVEVPVTLVQGGYRWGLVIGSFRHRRTAFRYRPKGSV